MGDGGAERPRLRLLHVDVNPLVVAIGLGEGIDLLLRDLSHSPDLRSVPGGAQLIDGGEYFRFKISHAPRLVALITPCRPRVRGIITAQNGSLDLAQPDATI